MASRVISPTALRCRAGVAAFAASGLQLLSAIGPAMSAGCAFEPQGEGRVVAVVDARTFRLEDGREIRLAGIEPAGADGAKGAAALSAILMGRDVTLRGADDTPDRYGRQPGFVFLVGSETPIQTELLSRGEALVAADATDKDCALALVAAEAEARGAKRGTWADPTAIKNTETPGDILAGIGRFTGVQGKVLSVRQAGATTYLNFGRNWTRTFAVTISRRAVPALEAAGISVKSLENRRIQIRGWVEAHGGPRLHGLPCGPVYCNV